MLDFRNWPGDFEGVRQGVFALERDVYGQAAARSTIVQGKQGKYDAAQAPRRADLFPGSIDMGEHNMMQSEQTKSRGRAGRIRTMETVKEPCGTRDDENLDPTQSGGRAKISVFKKVYKGMVPRNLISYFKRLRKVRAPVSHFGRKIPIKENAAAKPKPRSNIGTFSDLAELGTHSFSLDSLTVMRTF